MSDRPEPHATSDLSVLEAWRLLVKPAPTRAATSYVGLVAIIGLLNLSAIAALVAAAVPNLTVAMVAALLHTAFIPGFLLAFAVVPTAEVDLAEWLTLGFGFGLLVLIVGGLALALLPVPLIPIQVVGWTAAVTLTLSTFAFRRGASWRAPAVGSRPDLLGVAVVAAVAAALRLPGLGYSDFQGDETEVILRATGVVQNLPDGLFYHGKGPGEIVVVAVEYGLLGMLSEGTGRLPFALAGVGGVVAVCLLARRLLGTTGALVTGALLALNGYFVAFSRITQYQSLVLLLGSLGLWCAVRWWQGGSAVWPVLAGALLATAALAHYDALFFLPPIALLVLWRIGWRGLFDHEVLKPWFRGAQVGTAILALFFVPYIDSGLFALASDRIGDRVGAGFPYNNLRSIVASATLYLGTAFPLLVAALVLLGGITLVARRPDWPVLRPWLLGLVWAAIPFLFYAFVARKPGTHIHVATPGLMLLAGAGFASLWAALHPITPHHSEAGEGNHTRPARYSWGAGRLMLATALAAALGLVGAYVVPVYLLTTAEMVREDRADDLPLTWQPPGGLPTDERFGFPYQAGWKVIGALFADGTLHGSYDSNEQPQVTYWYTRGAWRCSDNPRYYLIAESVQEVTDTPEREIEQQYRQIGTIAVAGEPKLRVYERGLRARNGRPPTWPAEAAAEQFNRAVSVPTLDPGPWARGVVARQSTPVDAQFGEDIHLLGYQLYAEDPRPGGVVRVDLFWLPRVSSDEQHRIDVQLGQEPRIGDAGGPACDTTGAEQEWKADRPFTQRASIPISAGAAPGQYPLLVSVIRLGDGAGPLTPTGASASGSVLLEIGQVEIRDGSR